MVQDALIDLAAFDEEALFTLFDEQRALKLARSVSAFFLWVALGGVALLTLLLLVHPRVNDAAFRLAGAGIVGALVLFRIGQWYVHKGQHMPAAIAVVAGQLVAIFALQVAVEGVHGLDAMTVALFIITALPIGLSGVLGDGRLMFLTTGVANLLALYICFLAAGHARMALGSATVIWGVTASVQWAIALLIALAAKFYIDTLHGASIIGKAYRQMREVDEMKDIFIKNVNHELRNPVMSLSALVTVLDARWHDMPDDDRVRLIGYTVTAERRLQSILDAVLNFQRIQDGVGIITPGEVRVRGALEEAIGVTRFTASLDTHTWALDVADDLVIWGDAVLLHEVLTNILTNATKYSPAGSCVEVSARHRDAPSGAVPRVQIRVRDYGLGIPPEDASLLFKNLSRLRRDIEQNTPGSGLGLALSKRLVEAMHGTIRFESAGIPGEGTTFIIDLPMPPVDEALPAAL